MRTRGNKIRFQKKNEPARDAGAAVLRAETAAAPLVDGRATAPRAKAIVSFPFFFTKKREKRKQEKERVFCERFSLRRRKKIRTRGEKNSEKKREGGKKKGKRQKKKKKIARPLLFLFSVALSPSVEVVCGSDATVFVLRPRACGVGVAEVLGLEPSSSRSNDEPPSPSSTSKMDIDDVLLDVVGVGVDVVGRSRRLSDSSAAAEDVQELCTRHASVCEPRCARRGARERAAGPIVVVVDDIGSTPRGANDDSEAGGASQRHQQTTRSSSVLAVGADAVDQRLVSSSSSVVRERQQQQQQRRVCVCCPCGARSSRRSSRRTCWGRGNLWRNSKRPRWCHCCRDGFVSVSKNNSDDSSSGNDSSGDIAIVALPSLWRRRQRDRRQRDRQRPLLPRRR